MQADHQSATYATLVTVFRTYGLTCCWLLGRSPVWTLRTPPIQGDRENGRWFLLSLGSPTQSPGQINSSLVLGSYKATGTSLTGLGVVWCQNCLCQDIWDSTLCIRTTTKQAMYVHINCSSCVRHPRSLLQLNLANSENDPYNWCVHVYMH